MVLRGEAQGAKGVAGPRRIKGDKGAPGVLAGGSTYVRWGKLTCLCWKSWRIILYSWWWF